MADDTRVSVYEKLRQHYDSGQTHIPQRKEFLQIMQMQFTPEEAQLALSIPLQSQGRVNSTQLAQKTGKDEAKIEKLLEEMAHKGTVYAHHSKSLGRNLYALWEINRSLYTTTFGDGIDNDQRRRIAGLREKLWQAGWQYMMFSSRLPVTRVLPFEGGIASSEEVAPYEKASYFVEKAGGVAVIACSCRVSSKRCDKPIDSCLHFDGEAEYLVKYRGGRVISKEECLRLIEESVKNGLVLTCGNQQDRIGAICTCCSTCCLFLRPYIENHIPHSLVKSNFLPSFDTARCKLCQTCLKNCPVAAIGIHLNHEPGGKDHTMVIEERCIGCGVCTAVCPRGVIKLKRVRQVVPPATYAESLVQGVAQQAW